MMRQVYTGRVTVDGVGKINASLPNRMIVPTKGTVHNTERTIP